MKARITIKDLEEKQAKGTIRGFTEIRKDDKNYSRKSAKNIPKRNKTKEWIGKNLFYWAQEKKLELVTELQFHPERKWRFDWAFPEKMIAIEYEGLMSEKSRHTTVKGFTGDAEKYNEAQRLGWSVYRYTAVNHKDIINDLNKLV